MKRFKKIFVLYDDAVGGDDALSQAVALSIGNGAEMTIGTVLHAEPSSEQSTEAGKRMSRLVESIRRLGVERVSGEVLAGVPLPELIRRMVRDRHDLVILSEQSGKAMRDLPLASIAVQLMRQCPCPVWVIRPEQAVPYRRILAAIDPSPERPDDGLNVKIMDLAMSLAARDHAMLHVMHAWEVDGNDLDTIRSETIPDQHDAILRRHEKNRWELVKNLLAGYRLDDINHEIHLPRNDVGQAIMGLSEEENIDLLVMGTTGRCGIRGLVFGNGVESVLRSVKCGILAVKPDSYQSPIAQLETATLNGRENDSAADPVRRSA